MDRTSSVRRETRLPVRWPAMYSGEDFVSEGTVLDMTPLGWHLAGPMPVKPGMRLSISLWPSGKYGPIQVKEATVLWVKGCEFALTGPKLKSEDQAWITQFLNQRLSLGFMRQPMSQPAPHVRQAEPSDVSSPLGSHRANAPAEAEDMVVIRCLTNHGSDTAQEQAPARLRQRDHERIVNGIQARQTLRKFTGQDGIMNN